MERWFQGCNERLELQNDKEGRKNVGNAIKYKQNKQRDGFRIAKKDRSYRMIKRVEIMQEIL